jgi:outer membrane receptor protein involved in Fe transport
MAKQLDPNDPTPYFYDAILKQTTNRPVEALQDMQKAIELNNNRAVYRSRELLDSDLAARSASLARIYSDLGFQQLALVEGWKSVNTDPSNFSAHRFLADSYSILPRHEIARVSELLQSQLLQPLNTTPIQPRLAESNLFLISAAGPAALGFNEFNPLFMRNGINFQSMGLFGEHRTYAGESVLSGIYENASFSVGGLHFHTDGWRQNAGQKDFIGSTFLQLELSPRTSIQAEVRRRETERGDLQQRFFLDAFFTDARDLIDSYSVRLGGRHSFSPSSTMLASLIFQNRKDVLTTRSPGLGIELPQESFSGELQHLYRSGKFSIVSGIGYADVNGELRDPFQPAIIDQDIRHLNVYIYTNIKLPADLAMTAGISFDDLKGSTALIPDGRVNQFNPKFGVAWNPLPTTAIRASITRTIRRTLVTEQTLEPTQVSGFNQFFDDFDATRAWRYGLGIDQKILKELFGGAEFSMRRLKIPLIDITVTPALSQAFKGKEYLGRAYLFWTPQTWLVLRTEYIFEGFRNEPSFGEAIRLNTHHVPIGIRLLLPKGFSASLTSTYYDQGGDLAINLPVRSRFWTTDASINYRLPHRYGLITIGATNLSDRNFKYLEVDRNNARIQPARTIFVRATFALP